jgi:DegV family protein with EDD domain
MSIDETTAWLEEHKQNFCHFFTVDDLFHLFRGGRVNRATAILGSLASIKPILHVDHEGHLINIGKVRTRKKSLQLLVDKMELLSGGFEEENKTIFISHGDCEEDARYVADLVKERFGIDSFLINYVSPTIGAHSGPGTLALFFMGLHR